MHDNNNDEDENFANNNIQDNNIEENEVENNNFEENKDKYNNIEEDEMEYIKVQDNDIKKEENNNIEMGIIKKKLISYGTRVDIIFIIQDLISIPQKFLNIISRRFLTRTCTGSYYGDL